MKIYFETFNRRVTLPIPWSCLGKLLQEYVHYAEINIFIIFEASDS
jgi:hypothetical protein